MDDASAAGADLAGPSVDVSDPAYPERWEGDVALGDGGTMHVRPIRPDDGDRLVRFHERQSPESIYFRFFSPRPKLSSSDIERFTHVDYVDRLALVGLVGDDLIGVARYDRYRTRSDAEVAFFVDDEHHRRGVATVLLEHLAVAAREAGISGFTASVLPQNRRMLGVFTQAGFTVSSRFEDGVVEVQLAIEPTPKALAAIEERAKVADARSVGRLLRPRSIAVIGASRQVGTVGHAVFRNLLAHGFEGPVYPVNPQADHVGSVKAWATVLDIPDEIDLAVIATPADQVRDVVEQCAAKGLLGLVIISSGFSEAGGDGAGEERDLVLFARGHGMRLIGPNCLGVINTDPSIGMHATFADVEVRPGRLAISSQSGTIGAAIVDYAGRAGLGISTFVAVGNKADVSGNDLLRYWEDDEATDVVLLYLESFGNPRQFARIARRVSQRKPIVAVRLSQGARPFPTDLGATNDTAPLEAWAEPVNWPPDATVDALLAQTGIVRVDNLTQMVYTAKVLLHQPLPPGSRVAILSNASGTVQLATDACRAAGLDLATISDETRTQIGSVALPAEDADETFAGHHIELSRDVTAADVSMALCALVGDPGVDSVMVLYAPPIRGYSSAVAAALLDVAESRPKQPIVACFLGNRDADLLRRGDVVIPDFPFPEEAALALARVAHYSEWRREPAGEQLTYADADTDEAQRSVAALLEGHPDGRWLDPRQASDLLATHGIVPLPAQLVGDAAEAVAAAAAIGYPVAVKATGLARLAKTEAGGVSLDVHSDDEVEVSYRRMCEYLGDAMRPALVQAMADPGVECLIGLHRHPVLGDVMTLGAGGASAEQLEQVALRILPLTTADAHRLVASSRVAPLVTDAGAGALDALEDLLLRLGALADAIPEIAQIRLNPVLVGPSGAAVTDARIHLQPWRPDPRPEVRRL